MPWNDPGPGTRAETPTAPGGARTAESRVAREELRTAAAEFARGAMGVARGVWDGVVERVASGKNGDVAIVSLAHGKVNAMDVELCEAVTARFEALRQGDSTAVVLTAQGSVFSAGVDLKRIVDGGAAYAERFIPALCGMFEAVLFHPRPVVAAINGHAIAGGCVLACAADLRLMADGPGRIGAPVRPQDGVVE